MNWIESVAISWFAARHGAAPEEGLDALSGTLAADPALWHLLAVVRGAAAPERCDVLPESAGLRAVLQGIERLEIDPRPPEQRAADVLDALEAALRARVAAGIALEADPLVDPSSGLANRLLFLDRLGQAIAYAHRHDTLLAVCSIQVTLPAAPLEERAVVLEIADRLRHTVRELDTLGRLAADEFAIVVNDLHNREAGMVAIRKVEEVLEEAFDVHGTEAYAEPRFGIAFYPAHGHDPAMLLASARAALSDRVPVGIFGD